MRFSFDDICYDDTKSATKIPASEYLEQGTYPIYDQATDSIIAGFSNDSSGLNKEFPVVLFGDHSRVVKYIDRAFYIGADGVKILRPINADLSTEFLYYQLQFKEVPNTGYNRHFKYLKLFSYCCPNVDEQRAFLAICHQADKSKFSGFKSRFIEEFQGKGYKSQKLNSFAQVVTGSTPSRSVSDYWLNGAHPWVSAQDMGDKFVDATAELVSDSGMATCKLIPAGSLLYVCRGSIGVMSINRIDCATNQSICSAICDDSICKTEYLYYWLLYHEDEINSLGEGTSFKSLSQKTFASLKIQIPPIEEQLRFIAITRQADKSKYLN
jgi:type I restriction enzyme S subunit